MFEMCSKKISGFGACVYRSYKESISKDMNNDCDFNLHSMTKFSGWLRYW